MTTIISRIRQSDGQLVRVHLDGRETVMEARPIRPMSTEEAMVAALSDPDNQPLTPENEIYLRRVPQVRVIRRALRLSQEGFAARFHIPVGTLRDWEQGRKVPDAAAHAYLVVIGRNPSAVAEALQDHAAACLSV